VSRSSPRGCLTVVLIVAVLGAIGAIANACGNGGNSVSATSPTPVAASSPAAPATSPPAPAPPSPAPPPPAATSPVAEAPANNGGAWCTASASVYDADYDENNVYVNSNQPYTDATASADGYSWSYETNGSGYAEIYLNGPPLGAEITVTVGGATCNTSD
jgi:hypothetical protein